MRPGGTPEELSRLAERYWESVLEAHPTVATLHGDHRFDDRVEDVSEEADGRRRALWDELRRAVDALDGTTFDPPQQVTMALLRHQLDEAVAAIDLRLAELRVDQMTGVPAGLLMSAPQIRATTPENAWALTERYRQYGTLLDQAATRLRAGMAAGRIPARVNVERSIHQIDKYLASPLDADPFANLAGPPGWDGEGEWRAALVAIAADVVRPGFERYRHFLAGDLAPAARPDERAGLCWLTDGDEIYRRLVVRHTSLDDLGAEEIHQIGLDELDRLAGEYAEVGGRLFRTTDVAAIFERLRSDPELRYAGPEEILADARRYLGAATAAAGAWFGRLPAAPCELAEVPEHLAGDVPIAYYLRPAADGSRPGTYYVNTSQAGERTRYEAAAVAYHESIPGHHLQLAIATELAGLARFQRLGSGYTAYVEGWGLYAERLADEMGLYGDDLERLGMLAADSWRACRLVVDTGLHTLAWSRRQAIEFMVANAPVPTGEVEVEVDRYIGIPGQALAYKVGQREFLHLRDEARRRLAGRFDIRGFHDTVLGSAAVTLPVLGQLVDRWVKAQLSDGDPAGGPDPGGGGEQPRQQP